MNTLPCVINKLYFMLLYAVTMVLNRGCYCFNGRGRGVMVLAHHVAKCCFSLVV